MSTTARLDSTQRINRVLASVSSLAAHPQLNYYLASVEEERTHENVVNLYQYDQPRELVTYTTGVSSRLTKCKYDPYGSSFGAVDVKGNMYLWKFEASPDAIRPWMVYNCHSSLAHDLEFLGSGSFIASAGLSMNFR